jgi:type VI secretion system Hcp family effector
MKPGKRKILLAGIILAALLLAATPSAAAKAGKNTIGYLTIAGVTDGCSDVAGYEDSCLVYGFGQGVVVSEFTPPGGGGGRQGRPELSLMVTKPVDRASVKLLGKAVTGTQIQKATIRLAQDGSFKTMYSMELTDVYITGLKQHYDPLDPGQGSLGQLEDLTLYFRQINWVWDPGLQFCFNLATNDQC